MPFERVLQGSYSVPRRRRATALTFTLAFHAAAFCTIAIRGVWQVDELETPPLGVLLHQPQLPPRETASGGKQVPNRNTDKKPRRKMPITVDTVQPLAATIAAPSEPGDETTEETGETPGVSGIVTDGPTGSGTGRDNEVGVNHESRNPVIRPPTIAVNSCIHCPQPHVPPSLLSVSGTMRFIAKLCINKQGGVEKISVLRGLSEAVTADIIATLSDWRYQPYAVNGNPVPFCYIASFLFKFE